MTSLLWEKTILELAQGEPFIVKPLEYAMDALIRMLKQPEIFAVPQMTWSNCIFG